MDNIICNLLQWWRKDETRMNVRNGPDHQLQTDYYIYIESQQKTQLLRLLANIEESSSDLSSVIQKESIG